MTNKIISISVVAFFVFCLLDPSTQLTITKKIEESFSLKTGTLQGIVSEEPTNVGGGSNWSNFDENKYQGHSSESIQYLKEISLGREFESDKTQLYRWTTDMKIYVYGKTTPSLNKELRNIVSELNQIINPIDIEIVSDRSSANMFIYFGSYLDFQSERPNEDPKLLEENWGLFRTFENEGYMYVDVERADELEQKHLLREELTQSLGLFNDSYKYPESIFYQEWTTTTEYSKIDREVIDMLYNN